MSKPRKDPAELAALIGQGVTKALEIMDSARVARGKAPRNPTTALAVEHRRAVEANRRAVARHELRARAAQSQVTGGAVVAGVGGSVGVIDAIAQLGANSAGLPGSPLLWFTAGGIGLLVAVRGRLKQRRLGSAPAVIDPPPPPPPLPASRPGSAEIARFTSVRVQVMNMSPALDRLYPGSGDELRRADAEAAGPLTALAERLVVLDRLQQELPGTQAARQASASTEVVRRRLSDGCDTYDELLAAAARLLAAPDAARSTSDVLGPAVRAMVAYAHGLQRAADL